MTAAPAHRSFGNVLADLRWNVWHPLPTWLKWTVGVAAVVAFDAVRMAWGEHRFVGGFFEAFAAELFYLGVPMAAFLAALFGGSRAFERTNSKLVGWGVGLLIFFAIGSIRLFAEDIPGVGWRIKAMEAAHEQAEEMN